MGVVCSVVIVRVWLHMHMDVLHRNYVCYVCVCGGGWGGGDLTLCLRVSEHVLFQGDL